MIGLILGVVMTVVGAAQAAEPVVNCQSFSDGSVQVQMVIDPASATEAEIRAIVMDPSRCSTLAPDVIRSQVVGRQGNCDEVVTSSRILGSTMDYRALRCRTQGGVQESLMESSYMTEYHSEWNLRQVEGGTEVTLRIRTVVSLPVPSSMVRMGMQTSMKTTMLNLIRALAN